jgi:hypothetical protein
MELLVIKKEDRAAADLAKDVLDAFGSKIEEISKSIASKLEVVAAH